jgi:hypothetical protein
MPETGQRTMGKLSVQGQGRQPRRNFGPCVAELARFMASTIELADTLSLLTEIDRRWPGLSFRDFMAANVVAAAMTMKVEGRA